MSLRSSSLLVIVVIWGATRIEAQVCARVVIQIEQELTLEREGFEARLGISNGQPAMLENFSVSLNFADVDGNPVGAATDAVPNSEGKFYYRVQAGFTALSTVASGGTAKVAYLIVPTPGSAGTTAEGSIYYVGATVKYTVNGVEQTVEVAPDFIRVRPMPSLQLQYFLPGDVYGDDPMTQTVTERVVPFALGVRVINHSEFATARQLKIQSGQPEIIENEQGLLIDFRIIGCEVNGLPAAPSLLADFGDIAPQRSVNGDWLMTSSLSGRFVTFTAEITHAPEFGGALTSLIPADAITTHRLIGKVKVDLPGRDAVSDFLAVDNMAGDYATVKLYESDNDQVSEIVDFHTLANGAAVSAEGANYRVSVDVVSAKLFASLPSPVAQDKAVRAVRSDGKVLPAQNAWISKSKNEQLQWVYTLNLFDTDKAAGQTYLLTLTDAVSENRPPVLTIWGGLIFQTLPNTAFSIRTSAVDPDGLLPLLDTGELPDGASFVDSKNGNGLFSWLPRTPQIGSYFIRFRAHDASLSDTKTVRVDVVTTLAAGFDNWQQRYWPDSNDPLVIGPAADPDGDDVNNLLEYALNGDPTHLDDSILPNIGVHETAGARYLSLTFIRRTDDPTLVYEVVGSDTLHAPVGEWVVQAQTLPASQENLPAMMERVKVRDSQVIAGAHRYLRLRVTQPDSP
jgi:hypothetical protein